MSLPEYLTTPQHDYKWTDAVEDATVSVVTAGGSPGSAIAVKVVRDHPGETDFTGPDPLSLISKKNRFIVWSPVFTLSLQPGDKVTYSLEDWIVTAFNRDPRGFYIVDTEKGR